MFSTLSSLSSHHPQLAKRLFDVEVVSADGEVPVWHPDARFFKLVRAVPAQSPANGYCVLAAVRLALVELPPAALARLRLCCGSFI